MIEIDHVVRRVGHASRLRGHESGEGQIGDPLDHSESTPFGTTWWTDAVRDFEDHDYGDAIADVYDSWYADITDVDATVDFLRRFVDEGSVLELGVGTGRLAVPLAATGISVTGIDVSEAMLERLHEKDPGRTIETIRGDMVDDLPDGPFDLVFVAYNTFFNVYDLERQRRLLEHVAERLDENGAFVVEAYVPDTSRPGGDAVGIRSMTTDSVVLRADRHDPDAQTIDGQLVEITETGGVRLRPYRLRYATPDQLDAMAAEAGLVLAERWENTHRHPFDPESPTHVSVYRRSRSRILDPQ